MRPNLAFLSTASNTILKPGGPLKWKKRLVKDVRFSLPLTEMMKIARPTSPLLDMHRLSSPKSKAEAWQATCSSLSRKSNPKSVYSLLRSVAGFFSSSSSYPNCPNCSSPWESASIFADYQRSHFSVSQPKALRGRARGYVSELNQAKCQEESHSSFCSPFSPTEFLSAASNLSSSTTIDPDKAAYPMLKHLPRSGKNFLFHIFNLYRILHSFPSIWKTSSIIPIHKMGNPLDSPASFRPVSHLLRIKAF